MDSLFCKKEQSWRRIRVGASKHGPRKATHPQATPTPHHLYCLGLGVILLSCSIPLTLILSHLSTSHASLLWNQRGAGLKASQVSSPMPHLYQNWSLRSPLGLVWLSYVKDLVATTDCPDSRILGSPSTKCSARIPETTLPIPDFEMPTTIAPSIYHDQPCVFFPLLNAKANKAVIQEYKNGDRDETTWKYEYNLYYGANYVLGKHNRWVPGTWLGSAVKGSI